MLEALKLRECSGQPIRVGLIGAGAMGLGIVHQIAKTPGMKLAFIADLNGVATETAQKVYGQSVPLFTHPDCALDESNLHFDVLVEASSSIYSAARYCLRAIERKAHVVLMNAEVDLAFMPYLQEQARQQGVVITSDAGDQHGVLMRMIEEIQMWGFQITQAGNIKGFLDRYAKAAQKMEVAKALNLDLTQCIAYTDGTKLNIEMALIANAVGLTPFRPGMEGPKAERVEEALTLFDFDAYQNQGRIDYVLGAEPGGGVYVIGRCDEEFQKEYLKYYNVKDRSPYYLFYRPYHLCHLETPRAIALASLWGKAVLAPQYSHPRLTDVYAYAKRDLEPGDVIMHGIGDDLLYGLVHESKEADQANRLPIYLLTTEQLTTRPCLQRSVKKDQPLTWDDVVLKDEKLLSLYKTQQNLLANRTSAAMAG